MHNIKHLLVILLLSVSVSPAFAQAYNITGIIKDNVNEPLTGATVSLRDTKDSFLGGTSADIDGHFTLNNIQPGNYTIRISYLGFDDYVKNISVSKGPVVMGIIQLSNTRSTSLKEVSIVEKTPPVQQKEDTTQFNAGSYKVNPDATAEDLVRKMPGMDLSSGKPSAQGEQVAKVLVDGKPFFGDDPSQSLKNLPAEVIDKIQVYDEKSEQSQFTGFDDGNTSKTINIITKPGKKQGVFGRLYAGGGTDGTKDDNNVADFKHNLGGNLNYFKGDRRISLIGQSNNINIQNFSAQDLVGVSGSSGGRGGGGRGGMRRGGSSSDNFMTGQQGGISKTNAVGLNYSDKWGEKIDVTASYFYNQSENLSEQETYRNYVLPSQAGQTYNETSTALTKNYNHRFNMRFNYNIDSFNSILIIPSFSAQKNNSVSDLFGQTLLNATELLNQTRNIYSSDKDGYNLKSMFLYRHKFRKQGRTLSLWANGGYSENLGETSLLAQNIISGVSDTIDQESNLDKNGWNINSNLNYTEPLSKKSFLQVQYGVRYQQNESDKRTNNFSSQTGDYTSPDTLLSNTFSSKYLTHKGGLTFRFMDSSFNFNIGLDFQNANLNNERILPYANTLDRSFNNILPNARFQYNFNKKKNLRIFYRTSTDAPSVDQLQDVIDNTNPLQLSSGNPLLKQTYDHRVNIRYNSTNTNSGSTFFAMLSGTATQDYVGNSTIIAEDSITLPNSIVLSPGGQYTRPENLSGYYNLQSFATYGLPVSAIKSNLNMNASLSQSRIPGLINLERNYANNTAMGLGLVLSSNISEKIDFTLSSNSTYNIVKNTLNTGSDNNFFNQSTRLGVNIIFWKGIVFNSEMNHMYYNGLSAGYNQNYLLWNMSIAKKLLRSQQAEIKLSVFDLLKQNASIARTITETYSQDVRTNVLQQYFMLTFTYNLRFFKGGASARDIENNNDQRGDFPRGRNFGPPPGGPGGPPPGGPFPGM